jgi:hypothetical protein
MEKLIKETDQVDWILAVVVVFWDVSIVAAGGLSRSYL